jgi:hypothetical protein
MFMLAAAAMISSAAHNGPPKPVRPLVQAVAKVRIVNGVRLHMNGQANADAPPARDYIIRSDTGEQPARLIEFQ